MWNDLTLFGRRRDRIRAWKYREDGNGCCYSFDVYAGRQDINEEKKGYVFHLFGSTWGRDWKSSYQKIFLSTYYFFISKQIMSPMERCSLSLKEISPSIHYSFPSNLSHPFPLSQQQVEFPHIRNVTKVLKSPKISRNQPQLN